MRYSITSMRTLRSEFWRQHPGLERCWLNGEHGPHRPQNYQPTDTRCVFVDWIDYMQRDGQISEDLAQRATLD